ncbi:hypothetical protein WN944_000479 [Citrus x changshan-huyou]|uniref:Uncharacterized protein n=1 Tax=Citrus x changshan-huyou TaxID=2935761 RepID=A0AAP0MCY8_9ROSI
MRTLCISELDIVVYRCLSISASQKGSSITNSQTWRSSGVRPDEDTVRRIGSAFQRVGQDDKQKLAWVQPWPSRISGRAPYGVKPYNS